MEKVLKVLLVDDEALVREGLKTIIPWEEYGFSICGTAQDGREGLQKIRELKPDVAVVDIRMPLMDGLELSRIVREEQPGVRIVLLTGYSEFEYARSALRAGVKCYLLKPVEEEELIKELRSIRQELERESGQERSRQESRSLLFNRLLQELFHRPDGGLVQRLNGEFSAGFPWESYQIAFLLLPQELLKSEYIFSMISEFAEKNNAGLVFFSGSLPGILLRGRVLDSSSLAGRVFLRGLREALGHPVRLVLGDPCDQITDLPMAFESAASVYSASFLIQDGDLIDSLTISRALVPQGGEGGSDLFLEIVSSAKAGDMKSVHQLLGSVKRELLEFDSPGTAAKAVYTNILVAVYNALSVGERESRNGSLLFELYTLNQEMGAKESVQEIEGYIEEKIQKWVDLQPQRKSSRKIQPILQYISENLDKDLRLELLAREFGYNSSYLGKMFRDCTGEYFNNYVDRLKIERAKDYIRQGALVYEAAQKVGYTNINYFHIKFKKYTGVAPGSLKK